MFLKRDERLAIKGYEAFTREDGMCPWEGLPLPVKDRWVAAARAIAAAVVSGAES